jgi:hypothetical protein
MTDKNDGGQRFAAGGLAFLGCIVAGAGTSWLLEPTRHPWRGGRARFRRARGLPSEEQRLEALVK